jgi:cytochrome b pre-mRNA-processing protein 3
MTFLSNLFRKRPDPRESLRPLWHRVVELSRDPAFYRDDGVADSVAGRFDMISAILALVLLHMERRGDMAVESVLLTELFVADMDGQLRETGVGDVMVGKHLGKLMSVLGGRLGAMREALAEADENRLAEALARNVTLAEGRTDTLPLARRLRRFYEQLATLDDDAILAGRFSL